MKKNLLLVALCAAFSLPAAAADKAEGACCKPTASGEKAASCCKPAAAAASTSAVALPQGVKAAFYAVKMHCGGCVQGISTTLKKMPGVQAVSADLKGQRIKVTYKSSQVSSSQIVSTLSDKGFKATPIVAAAPTKTA